MDYGVRFWLLFYNWSTPIIFKMSYLSMTYTACDINLICEWSTIHKVAHMWQHIKLYPLRKNHINTSNQFSIIYCTLGNHVSTKWSLCYNMFINKGWYNYIVCVVINRFTAQSNLFVFFKQNWCIQNWYNKLLALSCGSDKLGDSDANRTYLSNQN